VLSYSDRMLGVVVGPLVHIIQCFQGYSLAGRHELHLAGQRSRPTEGTAMRLTKLAGCQGGTCPAIYATDRGTLVVQGAVVTDSQATADANVAAGETLVEIPRELLASLKV
jgi:hypothetical protein